MIYKEEKRQSLSFNEADYQKIKTDIEASFPRRKKDLCNDVLLISKHSEKL